MINEITFQNKIHCDCHISIWSQAACYLRRETRLGWSFDGGYGFRPNSQRPERTIVLKRNGTERFSIIHALFGSSKRDEAFGSILNFIEQEILMHKLSILKNE